VRSWPVAQKRALVIAIAAVVVAAAAIGIGLGVTSQSSPSASLRVPKGEGYTPPSTINATCSTDDTSQLVSWLYSLPNNQDKPTRVTFEDGGCYQIDRTMWLRGFDNWIFNGNGATFEQKSVLDFGTAWVGDNNPATAPYCGSTAFMNDRYSAITTNVLMIAMEGGCDVTWENLTIVGEHDSTGGDPRPSAHFQPDSFISFYGTQRALVDHVTMRGPYGDYVTIGGFHEAPGGGGGYPSTDITIENSNFSDAGRCGVSVTTGGHRITIEHNTFHSAALTVFDIELDIDYPAPIETDILIADNIIVGQHYGFLLSAQTGSELRRVSFSDNALAEGAEMRIFIAPHAYGGNVNNNIEIENNTSQASSTWPDRSPVNVLNVEPETVLVSGNVDPLPSYGGTGRPFANIPVGALACGNKLPSGKALDGACPKKLPAVTPPALAILPD
jgi:Right handed beta helix region